ncbi:hypothetical protein ACHAXR_007964 [Thalassiosira sp. AJA248-18]
MLKSNDNDSSTVHCPQQQPITKNALDERGNPRRRFSKSNSMNAAKSTEEEGTFEKQGCGDTGRRDGASNAGEVFTEVIPKKSSSPIEKSIARLCGPSRSKCGYCSGTRLHVLGVQDEFNRIIIGDATKKDHSGEAEPAEAEKKLEQIDETKTSKSYGLLFDRLPYGTYEDLINRGWRRSGKHLYRPHNFESCCPAISIRLDVIKFASRCKSQTHNASTPKGGGTDLARSILVTGSKSQRKVGKVTLRALETYNSKCTHNSSGGKDAQVAASFKQRSSFLSSDDSVKTSHVANMQLDDSVIDSVGCHGKEIGDRKQNGRFQTEPKHQHKKSRKQSPHRNSDKLDENSCPAKTVHRNLPATTTKQQPLHVNQEFLQPLLCKLSEVVYQTITKEAIESVASNYQGEACGNGSKAEQPKWAWWNNDVSAEDFRLPKWCSFKVSQPQPQAGSKQQLCSSANGIAVMASTSACAAASGRSRGKVDKGLLVRSVVDALKTFVLDLSQRNDEENKVRVKDVSFHDKSGHVLVNLDAPSAVVAGQSRGASNQTHLGKDPIAEFFTRHKAMAHKLNKIDKDMCTQKRNSHHQRFLTVRSVPAHESSLQLEVHQLFCRYQTAIHGDSEPFFCIGGSPKEKDDVHDYDYYQQSNLPGFLDIDVAYGHLDHIHRSKIKTSYLTFYRFLCETPVAQDETPSHRDNLSNEDGYDIHIPFGTYHQQYRLSTSPGAFDGPLVAVGVVDILPQSVSSVYAFYDPILSSSLELGKYTALREIEWVRRASQFRPDLHYYYLGYYIHSCQKMTYKAEYKPSELLCPVNLKWVDFEVGKKKLEECSPIRHCCALYTSPPTPEEESDDDMPKFKKDHITLDIGQGEQHFVQVGMLNRQGREYIDPHVNEFVSEVGGLEMCKKFIIKL